MSQTNQTPFAGGRSIVLVGLMGAGKTAIGKRLAALLNLPFYDADQEIERAAGMSIAEIFKVHGEAYFRAGEQRVIARLLAGPQIVLATGGGAFMAPETRDLVRKYGISVWLRCKLHILHARVAGRSHRPLLNDGDPLEILARLSAERNPVYALADIIIDGSEDPPHVTTANVAAALSAHSPAKSVAVPLESAPYEVLIGPGLIKRAGAYLAPVLAQKRVVIITDEIVAGIHLSALQASLDEGGIWHDVLTVKPGEASKCVAVWNGLLEELLERKVDRKTTIVALGGGVVGDLAGFTASAFMRGVPFVQIPTTLLAQVDSSVGGKTGVNSPHGKNLIGAFHQPIRVLADSTALATLPPRELLAGYAEIVKCGLIADAELFAWCEEHGPALLNGDEALLAQAIAKAVAFKAAVVGDDERETKPNNGRALLNLGHTFGHALEAEVGYGGGLLHGEAVGTGLVLAADLSVRLGFCAQEVVSRVAAHVSAVGLNPRITGFEADRLLAHMKLDKKAAAGKLTFVLLKGIGQAFTSSDVPEEAVRATLLANGAR